MAVTRQILGKVVITNKDEYNPSTVYEILDVVSYQGSSYLSKVYDNDSLPTDDTKWQLLARKGDTYEVSESDIENIANKITENANSIFNSNVSEKTKTFNSNAKTKTDEFNSNANTTVSAYNTNAEKKLEEYNDNDTIKLKKYNDNATSSVDNYNSNAGTKLNEYNTNSSDKLKKYNDNATKEFNNYNSNATTKLEEYNTNSDTKLKEYDEHSEELNTKINSTKNELERVKNNVLETGAGTGNFIHLEDSAMAELQELEVEGICEQRNTTGKNLLDYVSNIINSINGLNSIINEDGSITVSGKPTVDYISILKKIDITDILETGNVYTISQSISSDKLYVQINAKKTDGTYTYITTQNVLSQKILVDKSVYVSYTLAIQTPRTSAWGDSPLTITNKYMLCEGTDTAETSFEPYTGRQASPSPDFPQKIKTITDSIKLTSCNKNIFDFEKLKKDNSPSEISGDSVDFKIQTKDVSCLLKFPILIDNLYINFKISSNKMNGSIKVVYEDDKLGNVYEKYDNSIINDVNVSKLFNKNKKIKGIRILNFGKSTYFQIKEMLLAIDSKEELFVEHLENQITANLPEGEFIAKLSDTDKDTLNVKYNEKDGQYHLILNKKIKKLIMDGTINKFIHISSSIMTDTNNFFQFELPNKEFGKSGSIDYAKSNYLTYYDGNAATAIKSVCLWWENSEKYNYASLSYETLSEANSWLKQLNDAGRPLEIYYVEKNTYEIDLGVVDIPITYNEITNIFTDSDLLPQINVKYYRNFIKTIQNLQINNDTLKNELTSIENRLTALENANATAESEVSE